MTGDFRCADFNRHLGAWVLHSVVCALCHRHSVVPNATKILRVQLCLELTLCRILQDDRTKYQGATLEYKSYAKSQYPHHRICLNDTSLLPHTTHYPTCQNGHQDWQEFRSVLGHTIISRKGHTGHRRYARLCLQHLATADRTLSTLQEWRKP